MAERYYLEDSGIDRLNFLRIGPITGYFKHRDEPSVVGATQKILLSPCFLMFCFGDHTRYNA